MNKSFYLTEKTIAILDAFSVAKDADTLASATEKLSSVAGYADGWGMSFEQASKLIAQTYYKNGRKYWRKNSREESDAQIFALLNAQLEGGV